MNHPFLDTLFAYDRWATRTILEACAELTQEEFGRPSPTRSALTP